MTPTDYIKGLAALILIIIINALFIWGCLYQG
jgi:hypothetical protein